jgi:putative tricarboxylic transport membrane protein
VFILIAFGFIASGLRLSFGARLYPMILSILLAFLGVLLFITSHKKSKTDNSPNPLSILIKEHKHFTILIVGYILFIAGLTFIGFAPACFIFLVIVQYLLGYRKKSVLFINSAVFTLIVYFSFSSLLNVPLPVGIFLGGI